MVASLGLACGSPPEEMPVRGPSADCSSQPSSRWALAETAFQHFVGDEGTSGSSGAVVHDGRLVIYERELGEVWVAGDGGRIDYTFGRPGRGPGEFAARDWMRSRPYGQVSWLDVAGDTLIIFDGSSIKLFKTDGSYLTDLTFASDALRGGLRFSRRVRSVPGGVLLDVEERSGYPPRPAGSPRPYTFWRITPALAVQVAALELPALPRDDRGASFQSTREALPLWDVVGGCIIYSDGSSARLIVIPLDGGAWDTIPIPLHELPAVPLSEERELLGALGAAHGRDIEPALPLRIRQLAGDPDGWIWLMPVQHSAAVDGVEVLRVSLNGRDYEYGRVPGFPKAFGHPGVFFGAVRDSSDFLRLARFAAP